MEPLRIRPARAADAETIARANANMALETEGTVLDPARAIEGARAVLDDPSKGFYVVAERGAVAIGQLLVTTEWSDWRAGFYWWIQSVWVEPPARRTGVYRALHEHVVSAAQQRADVLAVRLYVERENRVAQATYEALGMTRARYDFYELDLRKSLRG